MKPRQASTTAEGIALARAMETMKLEGQRICSDPFARHFVNPILLRLGNFFVGYGERQAPGVLGFIVARARYIDDYLQSSIETGLEQLVILGAGYDSRAYRFPALQGQVIVFEVDHPASQRAKTEKLKRLLGKLPGYVTFVPIDFAQETLGDRLYACGYDNRLKTLFIWEGVTMYLMSEAVDSTLAFVAKNSVEGSSIIFDYIYVSLLKEPRKRGEISRMQRYRRFTGEGLAFGIEEGTIEEFLRQRGFHQVRNVTNEDLKRLYFTWANQGRQVASGYAIVSAVVGPHEAR